MSASVCLSASPSSPSSRATAPSASDVVGGTLNGSSSRKPVSAVVGTGGDVTTTDTSPLRATVVADAFFVVFVPPALAAEVDVVDAAAAGTSTSACDGVAEYTAVPAVGPGRTAATS